MANSFIETQSLIRDRSDLLARLRLIPYDGTPEIKSLGDGKYLYVRKRIAGKLTSTYVGAYTDELYNLLLRNAGEIRQIRKELRKIEKRLIELGYEEQKLSFKVLQNIDFARANMKMNIYDQAILEGVATSLPQTEEILENGVVNGVTAGDVQKILNLKHAWEFVVDSDVVANGADYYILCHIAHIVNEGFLIEGGRVRGVPVTIGGSIYVPPIPFEAEVKEQLKNIMARAEAPIDIAIELCLYCMRAQVFLDGNKRAAVIFANHYLISQGEGLLIIPEKEVAAFKKLLVEYYENADATVISKFLKKKCWKRF